MADKNCAQSIVIMLWHDAPSPTPRQAKQTCFAFADRSGVVDLTPDGALWQGAGTDVDVDGARGVCLNPHTGLQGKFVSQWRVPLRSQERAQDVGRAIVDRLAQRQLRASWSYNPSTGYLMPPTGAGETPRRAGPRVRVSYRDPMNPTKTLPESKGGVPVEFVNGSPVLAACGVLAAQHQTLIGPNPARHDGSSIDADMALAIQVSAGLDRQLTVGPTVARGASFAYDGALTAAMTMPNGYAKLDALRASNKLAVLAGLDPYDDDTLKQLAGLD